MTRAFLILGMVLFGGGCVSPSTHSTDAAANYREIFGDVEQPEPVVLHSHLEWYHKTFFGLFPVTSQTHGEWEFELIASRPWLNQIKKQPFIEVPFDKVRLRPMPDWFSPTANEFTAWRLSGGSDDRAHLFVQKNQASQDKIRVFICRH